MNRIVHALPRRPTIGRALLVPVILAVTTAAGPPVLAQSALQQLRDAAGGGAWPQPPEPSRPDPPQRERDEAENQVQAPPPRAPSFPWRGPPASSAGKDEEEFSPEVKKVKEEAESARSSRDHQRRQTDSIRQESTKAEAEAAETRKKVEAMRARSETAGKRLREQQDRIAALDADASTVVLDEAALRHPLVGRMVDGRAYGRAKREIERLTALDRKLDERIADLRKWRAAGERDRKEFERMRAEATWDLFSNLLSTIPIDDILKGRKDLDPAKAAHLKSAFAALRGFAASGEAFGAPSDRDRWAKFIEVLDAAYVGLTNLPEVPVPAATRKKMDTVQRALVSTARLGRWILEYTDGKTPPYPLDETIGSIAGAAVDVAAVWCPPVEVGQGAFKVLEAGFHTVLTTRALADLREVTGKNWSAEGHLLGRKAEIGARIRELRTDVVTPYELARKLEGR